MNWVYHYFDKENVLLYVGKSKYPFERLDGHASDKPWICDIYKIEMHRIESASDAALKEKFDIKMLNPKYNKQFSSKKESVNEKIKFAAARLIAKHKGLRKAARAVKIDPAYLGRIRDGLVKEPNMATMLALGVWKK